MQEELIDILLTTYNTKIEYLKIQLDSLINQTYKNIKIIICDDESTVPEVKEVLQEYANNDQRIELYFNTTNIGYIKNFEFLLGKSTANYIMFCDHDDIWYNTKVEKSYKRITETNTDLVYCDAKQIDENGKILRKSYIEYKHLPKTEGKNNILAFSRHIAIGCSQMFTKKIKEKMLPFKKNVMAHDWISFYLANTENGISYIDEPLLEYRLHDNNEFGGRSLKQNLEKWKAENGNNYNSYKKYRNKSIEEAYLNGSKMCDEYFHKDTNEEVLNYYEKIKNTKILNLRIFKYFKYLSFKGIKGRALKEIVLFHFPIIGYIKFKIS